MKRIAIKKSLYSGVPWKQFWVLLSLWAGLALYIYIAANSHMKEEDAFVSSCIGIGIMLLATYMPMRAQLKKFVASHSPTFSETFGVGAAFAITENYLLIVAGRRVFEIPYELIRDFRWALNTYVAAATNPLSPTFLADNFVNAAHRSAANRTSGLFIEIADVSIPLIRLNIRHEGILRRWTEAYQQKVDQLAEQSEAERSAA